ncbi:MAG: hypothetical protein M1825_001728 [Sarcosagium campestre]|nr:MAG: hypothetical protein M1825_001728 [Sarcosagium campestre]
MEDDLDYLAPDFNPASLTVPRIRSILVAHDVPYPASAKKSQLVEIFTNKVVSQSRKILSARSRTKRTSKGITDADSSHDSTVVGDDDDTAGASMEPPAIPESSRKKPGRKPRVKAEEDVEEEITLPKTPAKTPAKRSSTKHARTSDTELGPETLPQPPTARKSRKSEMTPTVKREDLEDSHVTRVGDESVFSDDNPFQSGSSPLTGGGGVSGSRVSSGEKRRKSAIPPSSVDPARRKSGGGDNRRKTDGSAGSTKPKANDGIVVPTSRTFEVPFNRRLTKTEPKEESSESSSGSISAGEEFTPEEQMDLTREQLKNGARDMLPPRKSRRQLQQQQQRRGRVSRSAPWIILLTLFGGYGAWWRQEKLDVGYCGVGRPSTTVAKVQLPDWASVLQPECEPCPQHAYCYPDLQASCEADFVLKPHPLSLAGLVPLPPTCEPDGEKARRVSAVANRAVEVLREKRARFECGGSEEDESPASSQKSVASSSGSPTTAAATTTASPARKIRGKALGARIDEESLKREVGSKRRKGMSQEEFEELWKGALGEILGREEVVSESDGHDPSQPRLLLLSSTSLARLPLTCAARRSVRLALARHRLELSSVSIILALLWYARRRLRAWTTLKGRVPGLVHVALDRLKAQAALHAHDPSLAPEPWIAAGQLRDDVLRHEFSPRAREQLWFRVRDVVELNANVRASVREVRAGDVSRVWEWIGTVVGPDVVDDAGFWHATGAGVTPRPSLGAGFTALSTDDYDHDAGGRSRRGSSRYSLGAVDEGLASSPLTPSPLAPDAAGDGGGGGVGRAQRRPEFVQRRWEDSRPIF